MTNVDRGVFPAYVVVTDGQPLPYVEIRAAGRTDDASAWLPLDPTVGLCAFDPTADHQVVHAYWTTDNGAHVGCGLDGDTLALCEFDAADGLQFAATWAPPADIACPDCLATHPAPMGHGWAR